MPSIEFENQIITPTFFEKPKNGLRGFLYNKGIVKTDLQVSLIYIGIILVGIGFISFFIYKQLHLNIVYPDQILKIDQRIVQIK